MYGLCMKALGPFDQDLFLLPSSQAEVFTIIFCSATVQFRNRKRFITEEEFYLNQERLQRDLQIEHLHMVLSEQVSAPILAHTHLASQTSVINTELF